MVVAGSGGIWPRPPGSMSSFTMTTSPNSKRWPVRMNEPDSCASSWTPTVSRWSNAGDSWLRVAEFAIHSAREEAVEHAVTQGSGNAVDEAGYPVLWAIAWRPRSASWILQHERILQERLVKP